MAKKFEFTDSVKGLATVLSDDIGDFIIRRADGTAPFLFCNAIDDAMMEISHVIRGEDHLANTPRQILILQTLGLPLPEYGHLALITGDDGAKLSKRHGSFSVKEMHEQGYLPNAIINYLTRLGHACDTQELLPFNELAQHFYLEKISRSPARFDNSQLMYWQKMAVQAMDIPSLQRWLGRKCVMQQVPLEQHYLCLLKRCGLILNSHMMHWSGQRFFSMTIFILMRMDKKSFVLQVSNFLWKQNRRWIIMVFSFQKF